jgi:hypothetical protein
VPAEEEAFVRTLVDRFEHVGLLVWVIAEEYQEAFSAPRVSSLAAIVREADDADHPIAVHKLSGTSFDEFRDDPDIDQFAMQTTAGAGLHERVLEAVRSAAGAFNVNMSEAADHGRGATGREENWSVAMAGAYVMALGWDVATTDVADLEGCGTLARFMESTRFDEMVPDDARASLETDYVLAGDGAFILYATARSGDLGVTDVGAGAYDLDWIDVASGGGVAERGVALSGDERLAVPAELGPDVAVYVREAGR